MEGTARWTGSAGGVWWGVGHCAAFEPCPALRSLSQKSSFLEFPVPRSPSVDDILSIYGVFQSQHPRRCPIPDRQARHKLRVGTSETGSKARDVVQGSRQKSWCRRWDSNPHGRLCPTVFETVASTIPPLRQVRVSVTKTSVFDGLALCVQRVSSSLRSRSCVPAGPRVQSW